MTLICGASGCRTTVRGIYCPEHKGRMGEVAARPTVHVGEAARFEYRGVVKEGIVERVMRSRVVVLIEVNDGTKEKLVTVDIADLQPKE